MKALALVLLASANFLAGGDFTDHPTWHLLDHEGCGESLSDRIIGGTKAELGQFPWMARIGYVKLYQLFQKHKPSFKCGGSLINNLYVVTAAHCVTELKEQRLEFVRLGEHNSDVEEDCDGDVCAPPVQDFKPEKILAHEGYQQPAMRHDIALIRLDRPAKISAFAAPICLPYGRLLHKNYTGSLMEVAGWGVNSMEVRQTSPILLHVRVPIVKLALCDNSLGSYATAGQEQLCAGGQIGYDSCGGDSGGPLMKPEVVEGPPKYYLMGIVSFGSVNCGSDAPAVYTDVRKYVEWILDHIEP